ncbi:type 3 dihydrofolate reductase [Candidatus Erwinia haradaeae]|uniref:Dihydrofolate reductase n=1 Tax=Candidatus Erwinia haradaeae TaxID=1922217 RepID=A0A803GDB1_9GAMM|nr:type 3 dihydrofolate reductase [Candidatus Erwinia haradaeae]VFP88738.1 Dihydrofolate reductase [Candidatus Erwinia haradaeae]
MISLIAAISVNRVIGLRNKIPWNLPADRKWFKVMTLHKPILMGRKTWESIALPLEGRLNIVISRQHLDIEGVRSVVTIEQALTQVKTEKELMVIGGGSIYQQMIPKAERLYLTYIDTEVEGDIYFPVYNLEKWKIIFSQVVDSDNDNPYRLVFKILVRR